MYNTYVITPKNFIRKNIGYRDDVFLCTYITNTQTNVRTVPKPWRHSLETDFCLKNIVLKKNFYTADVCL